jgi:hypothetical protein
MPFTEIRFSTKRFQSNYNSKIPPYGIVQNKINIEIEKYIQQLIIISSTVLLFLLFENTFENYTI